jgi:hypothetical protein
VQLHSVLSGDMTKMQFPWLLVGILIFGFVVGRGLGLFLAALGLFIAYFTSLRLHPRMRHWRCSGTGEHKGLVFTWATRKCQSPHCNGGRVVRFGARHLGQDHVQAEHRRTVTTRKAAKGRSAWR